MRPVLVASHLREAEFRASHVPSCGRGLGAHGMGSAAEKEALAQTFMKANKSPLIFHGSMFLNMLVIVRINISDSWLTVRLGGVWVLTYFQGRMGLVVHPTKDFMKKKIVSKYFSISSLEFNFFQSRFMSNTVSYV